MREGLCPLIAFSRTSCPFRSQVILHQLQFHVGIEAMNHVAAGAGVLGENEHIDSSHQLLADVEVSE